MSFLIYRLLIIGMIVCEVQSFFFPIVWLLPVIGPLTKLFHNSAKRAANAAIIQHGIVMKRGKETDAAACSRYNENFEPLHYPCKIPSKSGIKFLSEERIQDFSEGYGDYYINKEYVYCQLKYAIIPTQTTSQVMATGVSVASKVEKVVSFTTNNITKCIETEPSEADHTSQQVEDVEKMVDKGIAPFLEGLLAMEQKVKTIQDTFTNNIDSGFSTLDVIQWMKEIEAFLKIPLSSDTTANEGSSSSKAESNNADIHNCLNHNTWRVNYVKKELGRMKTFLLGFYYHVVAEEKNEKNEYCYIPEEL